jgi:hypothetical protein
LCYFDGSFKFETRAQFERLLKNVDNMTALTSARFRAGHAAVFEAVGALQSKVADQMASAMKDALSNALKPVRECITKGFEPPKPKAAAKTIEKAKAAFPADLASAVLKMKADHSNILIFQCEHFCTPHWCPKLLFYHMVCLGMYVA